MPRLRAQSPTANGEVPSELLNGAHPAWASEAATRRWLSKHDLTASDAIKWGPISRYHAAAQAWAMKAGITCTLPGGNKWLDWARMRQMGLPAGGGAGIRERMKYSGVRFAANNDE